MKTPKGQGTVWWIETDGTLHVDAVAMCKEMKIPPTPENQDMVQRQLMKVVAEMDAKHGTVTNITQTNDAEKL